MIILAVESSCDETAVALVEDGRRVLTDCIASQVDLHRIYGGVVPEIASRKHVETIDSLASQALEQAGLTRRDIDAIAVTYAPGLIGAVLVGVADGPIGVHIEAVRPVGPRLLERLGERELGPLLAAWVRREARFKCGTSATLLGSEPPLAPEERYVPVETFPDCVAGAAVLGTDPPPPPALISMEELLGWELGVRN